MATSTRQTSLTPLLGGTPHEGPGYYITPTVFLNPPTDSKLYREEIFSPVLFIQTFPTEEEAIELANDTGYGRGPYSNCSMATRNP
jgi:acyl-CoA reductase-like NAD-dependent aldehyde dehydrogenase